MKRVSSSCFMLLWILWFAAAAKAETTIPNCWDNPHAVKQQYIISVEKTHADLALHALEDLGHATHVTPSGYPVFFDNIIFVTLKARNSYDANNKPLPDSEFRKHVEHELAQLHMKHGVTVECNGIVHPCGAK